MKYKISKTLGDGTPSSGGYPPVPGRYTESEDARVSEKRAEVRYSLSDSTPFLLLACIALWLVFGGYEKVTGGSSVPDRVRDVPASTI